MGNFQSTEYNPYNGAYEYQSELERYYRSRMHPYNSSYYPSMAYAPTTSYYNNTYQQQYYYNPSLYQSTFNTFGYGGAFGTPAVCQQQAYGTPSLQYGTTTAYGGSYNNTYYPAANYIQRSFL